MKRRKTLSLMLGLVLVLGSAATLRAQGMPMGSMGSSQGEGQGMMMPGMMQGRMGMGMGMGMMHGPMMGMHGGMMEPGTHLLHLLRKARATATGETAQKLLQLEDRYYEKILRQQTDVRVAQHRFFRLLQDPEASDRDLQKAHQALMDKKAALAQTCFQGMLELRNILGAEAFANLFAMPMGMGSGMHRGMMAPQ